MADQKPKTAPSKKSLECDLIDEWTYSEAQTLARFDAFAEQLLKIAA